jgi:hypothetical protein
MVGATTFLIVIGTGYGAMLLVSEPKAQRIAVPLAIFSGLAVFAACVFVAEDLAGLL